VHRLREHAHLHRLLPARLLVADVVDRAADHEPQRVEACLLDEQELVDGEVGGEEAALHLSQALAAVLGNALGRGRGVAHLVPPRRWAGCLSAPRSIPSAGERFGTLSSSAMLVPSTCMVTTRSMRLFASLSSTACEIETPTTPLAP